MCACVCVRACQDQGVKEVQSRSTCRVDHVLDPVVKHRVIGARARRQTSTRAHTQRTAADNETDAARRETSAGASCKTTCKAHNAGEEGRRRGERMEQEER